MDRLDLLKKLCLADGVSGFESPVTQIMKDELSGVSNSIKYDNLGSVAFELKGSSEKPKILVVAHQDEIGFIVSGISPNGLIKFHNIGGWDWRTLLSSPVNIINSNYEKITGVIGSIPKHHLTAENSSTLSLSDMFIDIGASSNKDAEDNFGISLGDPIVPVCHFHFNERSNHLTGKAFDDRAGIAAVIEIGKMLSEKEHPNTVYCAGSVQEEVGIRGAQTLSELVMPDIALVVEGVPADDFPGNESKAQTCLGKGLQIRLFDPTMIVKPSLRNMLITLAKENNIPYQAAIRSSGGTDAKVIHLSGIGVPTLVVGVPVRYAHSHNGIMSLDDYNHLIELLSIFLLEFDLSYLKRIYS